jgi:hypothetical protein
MLFPLQPLAMAYRLIFYNTIHLLERLCSMLYLILIFFRRHRNKMNGIPLVLHDGSAMYVQGIEGNNDQALHISTLNLNPEPKGTVKHVYGDPSPFAL